MLAPYISAVRCLPALPLSWPKQTARSISSMPPDMSERLVMIDNYDSFTYNVIQYFTLLGVKDIITIRNDQLTLDKVIELKPTKLVISPGPGHPDTDSGICKAAISHYAGKIPILGVCMGMQCIYAAFGGKVLPVGDIVHGKVSRIRHDGQGVYLDVSQDIAVTRYHSLAGTADSLPNCLKATAFTENGVIMSVRHKEYLIEGLQYHPESILSEDGLKILKNFLELEQKGTSASARTPVISATPSSESILETIYKQRREDVAEALALPGKSFNDLQKLYKMNLAPPLIDFPARLRQNIDSVALMAEIKRASPSKGLIDVTINAAEQALTYAEAGSDVISVLTEPHWFKGSIFDLKCARDAVAGVSNRPAILRKEFIFDEYQILEGRLYGADSVLLIVAMLNDRRLGELYLYSLSLGMEPLVEINNHNELQRALALGAKIIGINNRNLHTFDVDLGTTTNLVDAIPKEIIVCALSGITCRADVEKFQNKGVRAILVGETLMRSRDPAATIQTLVKGSLSVEHWKSPNKILVKICGIRTLETAIAAAEEGADMIGLIFAKHSNRAISLDRAKNVVLGLRKYILSKESEDSQDLDFTADDSSYNQSKSLLLFHFNSLRSQRFKPRIVGVFRDNSLSEIMKILNILSLDLVQLHGSEPLEWAAQIPVPVIRAFHIDSHSVTTPTLHQLILIDACDDNKVTGGTGKIIDWKVIQTSSLRGVPFILAGGLIPQNVKVAIKHSGASAVDVSSGVEVDGHQDLTKIREFIRNVRSLEG